MLRENNENFEFALMSWCDKSDTVALILDDFLIELLKGNYSSEKNAVFLDRIWFCIFCIDLFYGDYFYKIR